MLRSLVRFQLAPPSSLIRGPYCLYGALQPARVSQQFSIVPFVMAGEVPLSGWSHPNKSEAETSVWPLIAFLARSS